MSSELMVSPEKERVEISEREIEKISEIARYALLFATDRRYYIPLTPENYERCYKIVERLYEKGEPITWENFIREWGAELPSSDKETALAEASARLYAVAEELANHAELMHGVGRDFDSTMEIFTDGVREAQGKRDIAIVIKSLLEEVAKARKRVDELSRELEESKRQIKELKQELKRVQMEALTDRLTGALNRGSLETMVSLNVKRRKKNGTPFCVAIFDIDNFKEINDTHGHLFGDEVLRKITEVVRGSLSSRDLLYRYGGDEFCVLFPGRNLEEAFSLMERAASNVRKIPFIGLMGKPLRVSLSVGIAEAGKDDTPKDLLLRADEALYLAKESGKNAIRTDRDVKSRSPWTIDINSLTTVD